MMPFSREIIEVNRDQIRFIDEISGIHKTTIEFHATEIFDISNEAHDFQIGLVPMAFPDPEKGDGYYIVFLGQHRCTAAFSISKDATIAIMLITKSPA